MITYNLICGEGHEFEGWFSNSAAFDTQATKKELVCPICGDVHVGKAIMAPAVKGSATKAKGQNEIAAKQPTDAAKAKTFMAGYRKFILDNAENVGPKFPEEARKIHYGETEERHIYGEAKPAEVKDLIEEGVEIAPVPPDPDELN